MRPIVMSRTVASQGVSMGNGHRSFPHLAKLAVLTTFIGLSANLASASNISFQGTFTEDDQVQLFSFSIASSATVTLRTYGYAGGINAQGHTIAAGGFDPILSLFTSTTMLKAANNDGTCGQVGTGPGGCLDSFLQISLAAGAYTLALTENDNIALGPNFSNGFSQAGQGNFTGPEFGCSNGIFCDSAGDNENGNWEVDLLNVTSASVGTGTPEPGTLWLLSGAFVAALGGAFLRRRRIVR
jgi:hypothetical protein